jgi:uncharacterized membrane protein
VLVRWWQREAARQFLALPGAVLGAFVPGETTLRVLSAWDGYAAVYLALTWLALRRGDPASLRAVSTRPRIGAATGWLVSSPAQFSQAAAAVALIATVLAMPQARELGIDETWVLVICLVAVVASWLVLQTGFLLTYVATHGEHGGLDFPGGESPGLVDFVYFTVAVGTTFGTTDVTVTRTAMRREVLTHGVLAFVFNTLVLTVAITFTTSYL